MFTVDFDINFNSIYTCSVYNFPIHDGRYESSGISKQLECGPMPNVMVALPIIGGALCSTPQSLADAYYLTAVQ